MVQPATVHFGWSQNTAVHERQALERITRTIELASRSTNDILNKMHSKFKSLR